MFPQKSLFLLVIASLGLGPFLHAQTTAANSPAKASPPPAPVLPLPPHIVAPSTMPVQSWSKDDHAVLIKTSGGVLRLEPFLNGVLHVSFGPADVIAHLPKSFVVLRGPDKISWSVKETPQTLTLMTPMLQALVDRSTGRLTIEDATGKVLLQEPDGGGRSNSSAPPVRPRQIFASPPGEALYGLGEHAGHFNWANEKCELIQANTRAVVPVLLSTGGYSIYWDNPSRTLFENANGRTIFTSDWGKLVDYYVMAGPKFDDLVARYRELTGAAPMFPRWAMGFHQSRNRYGSQKEIVDTLQRLRTEKIPVDSIFLDYHYWANGIGSHQFVAKDFPDPKGMVDSIHQLNGHMIITVWPSFDKKGDNYKLLNDQGFILNGVRALDGFCYDPFNPGAADAYWKLIAGSLVPLGIDGWFLDGPEPDNTQTFLPARTFAGPALEVQNLYPLVHTANFYNGLHQARPDERSYIITRCAFAGQQRNGTTVWSGDIKTGFASLKEQIPSGLDLVASGIPYWTTDVGGYQGGDPADPAFQESYTRWFEYGAFCPIFRTHGKRVGVGNSNELWSFGPQVQKICTDYDSLRYRLLPYIYSLTAKVTREGYTIMRLLPFDFPGDVKVRNITDQFMFGPAFLVNPVTDAGAVNSTLYLPEGAWTDFWTGETRQGGQEITADAPLGKMPLYVRAGSIVPMGPALQYADEKPADPIELRIYPGADGDFTLYEDDGKTMACEKGQFSTIAFHWDDKTHTLHIGARKGAYPGQLASRTFNVVRVDPTHGTGPAISDPTAAKQVTYTGAEIDVIR